MPLRVPGDRSPNISPPDWTACHGLGEGSCSDVAAPEARGRNRNISRTVVGANSLCSFSLFCYTFRCPLGTVEVPSHLPFYVAYMHSRCQFPLPVCPFTAGLGLVRTHARTLVKVVGACEWNLQGCSVVQRGRCGVWPVGRVVQLFARTQFVRPMARRHARAREISGSRADDTEWARTKSRATRPRFPCSRSGRDEAPFAIFFFFVRGRQALYPAQR